MDNVDHRLQQAIAEAKRFIERAEKLADVGYYDRKQSGTVRRSSMELSRALSEWRNPQT